MSSLPEKIHVMCPKCGEEFADWDRAPADPATSAVCPHCKFDFTADAAIRKEGRWQPEEDADAYNR
jgi:hypothetical protein